MARKAGWSGNKPGWSQEMLLEKAREWERAYGRPPTAADWTLYHLRARAIKAQAEADKAWKAYAEYRDGDWPSWAAVKRAFGTWGAFKRALGHEPRRQRGTPSSRR